MRLWLASLSLVLAVAALSSCRRSEPRSQSPQTSQSPPRADVAGDWKIEPSRRVGDLHADGSQLDLIRAHGAANVRDTSVALGEGETAPGVMLYPDDPQRRLEIIWADPAQKRGVRRVVLRGERTRWMLPRDISLGTSASELAAKNGGPFQLAGFGWDYAGVVLSWRKGALDSLLGSTVKLYLEPRIEDRAGPQYPRVLGDRDFSSSHPAMKALNPRVYQIFVDFNVEPATRRRTP